MLLALAAAGCGQQEEGVEKDPALDLAKLEGLAELDCTCRLGGVADSVFGKRFKDLAKEFEQLGYATSSVPASYGSVCFPAYGENACVSTGGYLPSNPDNFFCTETQGLELERVWNSVEKRGNGSITDADAAMLTRLEKMRAAAAKSPAMRDCKPAN